MITKELFEKLQSYSSESVSDIKEALLMLIDIYDEASERLETISGKKLREKEYDESIEIVNLIRDLDQERELIETQVVGFDFEENEAVEIMSNADSDIEPNEKIDYSAYSVDNEIVHDLTEGYTFKRPLAFIWEDRKYKETTFKGILVKFSNILIAKHGDDFGNLSDHELFKGRKRRMISGNPDELLDPRLLNDSKTYIHTCLSSNAIVGFIKKLIKHFGYNEAGFKIFLRADYKDLH